MSFLGEKYLFKSEAALAIFETINKLPIVDPHNHADVKELADNLNYPNPWQLFAATDHYVWEVLRKRSVPEEFITGDADPKDKWMKMATVFPDIAGNPVYEWIHLDLQRYLTIFEQLSLATGEDIWNRASMILAKEEKKPLELLDEIGVEVMCSTDDPVDSLEYHEIVNKKVGGILVRPTWRPDKAMNIFKPDWKDYIKSLEKRFNASIKSVAELIEVLQASHDYFDSKGCRASDHGLEYPVFVNVEESAAEVAFEKAMDDKPLHQSEIDDFMGYIFAHFGEMNSKKDWVFQMHIGAVRDVRDSLANTLGPDVGGDVSNHYIDILPPLKSFLNKFDDRLKVVLYCLEPGHQATLATMSRAFGAKVNLGSAWWLCDTPVGMRRQLEYIGSVDLFSNFVGMVSDSRKLLSYGSRHEMFRRILADVLADMCSFGQIPFQVAEKLAEKMAYTNPKEFFQI